MRKFINALSDFVKRPMFPIAILVFVGAFLFVEYSQQNEKNRRKKLYQNSGFAIGENTYQIYNSHTYFVDYTFIVNHKKYKDADCDCGYDSDSAFKTYLHFKEDDKFLVLYDLSNPKNSIIRLDYPIKDSSDFKRYVLEFELKRTKEKK